MRLLKKSFPARVLETVSRLALATSIEVWFQDEMRVGQKNSLVYQWAKKGTRPRQPKDQRYENAYLFGAVCPSRDTGVAIIMPYANTAAMRKHLEEISRAVAPSAHAMVILDQAGWHTTRKLKVPKNLTMVSLPPACPELNAAENIWQYLRHLSLEPCVQELHPHSRRLSGCLAQAPRRDRPHRLHRYPRLGNHRSIIMKAGNFVRENQSDPWSVRPGQLRSHSSDSAKARQAITFNPDHSMGAGH